MNKKLYSPFQYWGGKGKMITKLLKLIPEGGKPYCEPYAGSAALFFARKPAPIEVLNDLNGDIINFYRILQDKETAEKLIYKLEFTLYSREEFQRAMQIYKNTTITDPLERAWAWFVMLNQAFSGKIPTNIFDWCRTFSLSHDISGNVARFLNKIHNLSWCHERLKNVQLDCIDAIKCIQYWDNEDAIFYIDPPYPPDTRKTKHAYAYELKNEQWEMLVATILQCKGCVILSTYNSDLLLPLQNAGWHKIEYNTVCHAVVSTRENGLQGFQNKLQKVPRTEVVWVNSKTTSKLGYLL